MHHVLNEVVIDRGAFPSTVLLEVFVDRTYVTSVEADGLIIATPSGSTAYSMSAGGPMVAPSVPCTILTPIAPLSLSFRPVVLPESSDVCIHLPKRSRANARASFDGKHSMRIKRDTSLFFSASLSPLPVITLSRMDHDWYDGITSKLKWNSPTRSLPVSAVNKWQPEGWARALLRYAFTSAIPMNAVAVLMAIDVCMAMHTCRVACQAIMPLCPSQPIVPVLMLASMWGHSLAMIGVAAGSSHAVPLSQVSLSWLLYPVWAQVFPEPTPGSPTPPGPQVYPYSMLPRPKTSTGRLAPRQLPTASYDMHDLQVCAWLCVDGWGKGCGCRWVRGRPGCAREAVWYIMVHAVLAGWMQGTPVQACVPCGIHGSPVQPRPEPTPGLAQQPFRA